MAARPVWMAFRKRNRSVRERRISTAGPGVADRGRASATYWLSPSDTVCTPCEFSSDASCGRSPGASVDALIWPSTANAMSLSVTRLNCSASASSSRNPSASAPSSSGLSRPTEMGTTTT